MIPSRKLQDFKPNLLSLSHSEVSQLTKEDLLFILLQQAQSSTRTDSRDSRDSSSIQPITSIELPQSKGHPPQVININVQMPSVSQIANPSFQANPIIETKALANSSAEASSEKASESGGGDIKTFITCILLASLVLVMISAFKCNKK